VLRNKGTAIIKHPACAAPRPIWPCRKRLTSVVHRALASRHQRSATSLLEDNRHDYCKTVWILRQCFELDSVKYSFLPRKARELNCLPKRLDPVCCTWPRAPSIITASRSILTFNFDLFHPTTAHPSSSKDQGLRSVLISTRKTHPYYTSHDHAASWVSCRSRSPPPTPPARRARQPHQSTTQTLNTLFPESHARNWKA